MNDYASCTVNSQTSTILSIIVYSVLWAAGFAIGLIMGFSVPVLGDVIAVLIVGSLVIGFQVSSLPAKFDKSAWLKRTIVGLVVGTGASFLLILLTHRLGLLLLKNSHIIGFPIIILVIGFFQYSLLVDGKDRQFATFYVVLTTFAVLLAMILLALVSERYNLKIGLLQIRQRDYSATVPWAIMGAVLGLFYSLSVSYLFSKCRE